MSNFFEKVVKVMKNKRKSLLILALLILVGISSIFVAGTYAKYTSTISNVQGEAIIAKWTFGTANQSVNMVLDFTNTYDANTLIADRIAPGTSGTFDIALSNAGGETGVDYTLTFGNVTPSISGLTLTYNNANVSGSTVTGTLAPNGSTTISIDWAWVYYQSAAGDTADTAAGEAGGASGTKLTVPLTITGVQTQPTTSP